MAAHTFKVYFYTKLQLVRLPPNNFARKSCCCYWL